MHLILYSGVAGFVSLVLLSILWPRFRVWLFESLFDIKPSNQKQITYMDGLRGILALQVALFHSWQWFKVKSVPEAIPALADGVNAVALFVTISGFFIYRSLLGRGPLDWPILRSYFVRRLLRIYPLYLFLTVLIFAGGWKQAPVQWSDFLSDVFMLRIFGASTFANPPAWSLYVEEGFYFLLPVWFFLTSSLKIGGRRLPTIWSSAATVLVCLLLESQLPSREFELVKFFFVGMFLSDFLRFDLVRRWITNGYVRFAVVHVLLGIAIYKSLELNFYHGRPQAIEPVVWCLIFFVSLDQSHYVKALLSTTGMRILGMISYSTYLCHSLIITAGTDMVFQGAGGLSSTAPNQELQAGPWLYVSIYGSAIIFFSMLSYMAIELPFLRLRRKMTEHEKPSFEDPPRDLYPQPVARTLRKL